MIMTHDNLLSVINILVRQHRGKNLVVFRGNIELLCMCVCRGEFVYLQLLQQFVAPFKIVYFWIFPVKLKASRYTIDGRRKVWSPTTLGVNDLLLFGKPAFYAEETFSDYGTWTAGLKYGTCYLYKDFVRYAKFILKACYPYIWFD